MSKPRARMYKFEDDLWYAEVRYGKLSTIIIYRITRWDGHWMIEGCVPFVGF